MGKSNGSQASNERRNWGKIFNALTQMLQTQQNQLETLVNERKLLEDRVQMQHERWVADIRLYDDHISQMKNDLFLQDMERSLQTSKSDLLTGLKQMEVHLHRLKIEHSEAELGDFKSFFDDLLSHKNSSPQETPLRSASETAEANGGREGVLSAYGNTAEERRSKALEAEVRRLRSEYEKLASEKRSEVTALVNEKKFLWNQYNVMENDYTGKLKSKQSELELANQKLEKLLATLEQLQSSSNEKDAIIATLRNQVGKMETDSSKLNDEISRLSRDLEVQRKPFNENATPVLNPCNTARTKAFSLGGKNGTNNRSNVIVNKDTLSAQPSRSVTTDSSKVKDKISRLSHDLEVRRKSFNENLEVRRKSFNENTTPVLKPCNTAGTKAFSLGGKNGTKNRSNVLVNKNTPSTQPSRSGNKKRRGAGVSSDPETPRLFTSNFKVPKLKNNL